MSPNECKNTLGGVQFTVLAEIFRLRNAGEHVDCGARDDSCLFSRHNYWSHMPTGIQTTAALCGTSSTEISCRRNWRLLKSQCPLWDRVQCCCRWWLGWVMTAGDPFPVASLYTVLHACIRSKALLSPLLRQRTWRAWWLWRGRQSLHCWSLFGPY